MGFYNKAISIDSTYGEAYKSRAQLKSYLGDRDAACKDYLYAEKYGVPNLYNFTKFCK
jgi:Tfp pilus assembly protein PilF